MANHVLFKNIPLSKLYANGCFLKSNIHLAIVLGNEKQKYKKTRTFEVRKWRRSVGNHSILKWYRESYKDQALVQNDP